MHVATTTALHVAASLSSQLQLMSLTLLILTTNSRQVCAVDNDLPFWDKSFMNITPAKMFSFLGASSLTVTTSSNSEQTEEESTEGSFSEQTTTSKEENTQLF